MQHAPTCCTTDRSQETFPWFAEKFQELSSSSSEGTSLLESLAFVRLLSILREKIYQKEVQEIFETDGQINVLLLGFLLLRIAVRSKLIVNHRNR